MLFNSYAFIFAFLPVTFAVYFLIPKFGKWGGVRAGTLWLSFASLVFYGYWDIRYVPLLSGSICWNFAIGRFIESKPSKRKLLLTSGIIVNLLLLGYYKYTAFFIENLDAATGLSYDIPHIILPLGISFFTFTQTAYIIDAYRGETKGYSFITYLMFVTIFPHLIAGPIINHRGMIPQFMRKENLHLNWRNLSIGLALFSVGLFKKVVIADSIAPWADEIFANASNLSFIEAWIGAIGYTFQLYFDFSGYSEMAIGLGLMFNLKFPVNFNSPYQSSSMIDFWRRWHMTLGLWVKDYLYIPMGGNRHGELKKMRNLLVSMLIIGLWHGAGWTFVLWGGLHGVLLTLNHQWRRLKISIPIPLARTMTFIAVMCLWVFFRADSVTDALSVLRSMLDISNIMLPSGGAFERRLGFLTAYGIGFGHMHIQTSLVDIAACFLILGLLLMFAKNPIQLTPLIDKSWSVIIISLMFATSVFMIGMKGTGAFLYFQF